MLYIFPRVIFGVSVSKTENVVIKFILFHVNTFYRVYVYILSNNADNSLN